MILYLKDKKKIYSDREILMYMILTEISYALPFLVKTILQELLKAHFSYCLFKTIINSYKNRTNCNWLQFLFGTFPCKNILVHI